MVARVQGAPRRAPGGRPRSLAACAAWGLLVLVGGPPRQAFSLCGAPSQEPGRVLGRAARRAIDERLVQAAGSGNLAEVDELLAEGVPPSSLARGQIPLVTAASGGHLEVVEKLLAAGAEVDSANANDVTALIAASFNGHGEIMRTSDRLYDTVIYYVILYYIPINFALGSDPLSVYRALQSRSH